MTLYDIAMEYHRLTEDYDQIHCRYKNKYGIAVPITDEEVIRCNKNAQSVRKDIMEKYGLSNMEIREEVKKTLYGFQSEFYNKLNGV